MKKSFEKTFNLLIDHLIICIVILIISPLAYANCSSTDLTGDCFTNFKDYAVLSKWWMVNCDLSNNICDGADFDSSGQVDPNDLRLLIDDWLVDPNAFITTWDTSLGVGSSVTLALAGTVDVRIDWGDGSFELATAPGLIEHYYFGDNTIQQSLLPAALQPTIANPMVAMLRREQN